MQTYTLNSVEVPGSIFRPYGIWMAGKPTYSDEDIIAALVDRKGLVFLAAKKLGCDPDTIYKRAKSRPKVAACIANQRAEIIDTGEMRLFEAVERGDQWAVAMVLKTLGKGRGYVERTETRTISDAEIDAALDDAVGRLAATGQTQGNGASRSASGTATGTDAPGRSVPDHDASGHDSGPLASGGTCF